MIVSIRELRVTVHDDGKGKSMSVEVKLIDQDDREVLLVYGETETEAVEELKEATQGVILSFQSIDFDNRTRVDWRGTPVEGKRS